MIRSKIRTRSEQDWILIVGGCDFRLDLEWDFILFGGYWFFLSLEKRSKEELEE